jgi:hypothetical protein
MADFDFTARAAARAAGLDTVPGEQPALPGHAVAAERAGAALAGDLGVRLAMRNFSPIDLADRLPPLARAKLERLRDERDAIRSALEGAMDRRDELRTELQHWESRQRQLQSGTWAGVEHVGKGGQLSADHPAVREVAAKLSAIGPALERQLELVQRHTDKWNVMARLVTSLEDYLGRLGNVELLPFDGDTTVKVKGGIFDAVEGRRKRLRELAADRHTVESAPMPSAWCKTRAKEQIDQLAQRGPDVLGLVEIGEPIRWPTRTLTIPVRTFSAAGDGGGVVHVEVVDTAGLIAWLDPEQLYERVAAEIDAMSDDKAALTDAARAARLAQIAGDKLATEREEDFLIERAEQEGMMIARRTDADARAVLHLSGDLPAPRD